MLLCNKCQSFFPLSPKLIKLSLKKIYLSSHYHGLVTLIFREEGKMAIPTHWVRMGEKASWEVELAWTLSKVSYLSLESLPLQLTPYSTPINVIFIGSWLEKIKCDCCVLTALLETKDQIYPVVKCRGDMIRLKRLSIL
jgi:hypothetical protein